MSLPDRPALVRSGGGDEAPTVTVFKGEHMERSELTQRLLPGLVSCGKAATSITKS